MLHDPQGVKASGDGMGLSPGSSTWNGSAAQRAPVSGDAERAGPLAVPAPGRVSCAPVPSVAARTADAVNSRTARVPETEFSFIFVFSCQAELGEGFASSFKVHSSKASGQQASRVAGEGARSLLGFFHMRAGDHGRRRARLPVTPRRRSGAPACRAG